jgi:hypothetical protein
LLKACETDYAMLLSSGIEILKTNWLDVFLALLRDDKDLGAARFLKPVNHFDTCYKAPAWWPNIMILNMTIYRQIMSDDDWDLSRISYERYEHKHLFDGLPAPKNPDPEGITVFLDTGYNLWKKLEYNNPHGYRMINFDQVPNILQWQSLFGFYLGLDRNSYRPEHDFVVIQRANIRERLKILRCQS